MATLSIVRGNATPRLGTIDGQFHPLVQDLLSRYAAMRARNRHLSHWYGFPRFSKMPIFGHNLPTNYARAGVLNLCL